MFGSGRCPSALALRPSDLASRTTTLMISNEKLNDVMKTFKSLEECGLLIKGVKQTIKRERTKRRVFQYVIRYIRC